MPVRTELAFLLNLSPIIYNLKQIERTTRTAQNEFTYSNRDAYQLPMLWQILGHVVQRAALSIAPGCIRVAHEQSWVLFFARIIRPPENSSIAMSETILYSVIAAQDGYTVRLGWISSATGITYCGICLRSALQPRVGDLCDACGACVVGVFDPTEGPQAIHGAWSRLRPATLAPVEELAS